MPRVGGAGGVATVDYIVMDERIPLFARRYRPAAGTLVFDDGVQERAFSVPLIDDQANTPVESFRVVLVNATGGAAVDPSAGSVLVTVRDDDPVTLSGGGCALGDLACQSGRCFIATRVLLTPVVFAVVHPLSVLMLLAGCGAICLWARFRCRRAIALLRVADPGDG